jgi:hypothetical protein
MITEIQISRLSPDLFKVTKNGIIILLNLLFIMM